MKAAQTSSSYECYFEGGPVDGRVAAHQDTPPILHYKVPNAKPAFYADRYDPNDLPPPTYDMDTFSYYRELVPHRSGCTTYFASEAERDRAALEDGFEVIGV